MNNRSIFGVAAAAMIAAAAGASGFAAGAQDAKPSERTLKVNQVARVAERVVTAEEMIEKITEIERGLDPDRRVAETALDLLVAERLLDLEAERLEVSVKAREIGDEMAAIEKTWRDQHEREDADRLRDQRKRGAPEDPESWEGWLGRRTGMKPAEFSAWLRPTAARNIRLKLVVGYWEETSENAEAWGIRCATEQQAIDLRNRAMRGENFASLARNSNEERGRDNGGKLGSVWRNDGRLDPEVDGAFWKLKDGEITPPVKAEHGWWIVLRKVTVLANEAPFFELREALMKKPNIDNNRFQGWRNAVAAGGRYKYERRVPGWDCTANQP